jgi:hypothetical protein
MSRRRLLQFCRRVPRGAFQRRRASATLVQLENARCPLLFSVLPRMLRGDGTAPQSLQSTFRYVDERGNRRRSLPVSGQSWRRALATSRELSARRAARRGDP